MGKINYQTAVLSYLKQHAGEDVSRDVLIKETKVSKSRLSEVLRAIRNDGYNIITPPRSGIIRLEMSSLARALPKITDQDIRQWLILFFLSKAPQRKLTYRQLLSEALAFLDTSYDQNFSQTSYDNASLIHDIRSAYGYEDVAKKLLSVPTLRKDLNHMREQGIVLMKRETGTDHKTHVYYTLTDAAPRLLFFTDEKLLDFYERSNDFASSTSGLAPLAAVYKKIQLLIDTDDITRNSFGKNNAITPAQMEAFQSFISHPYQTNVLSLAYTKGNAKHSCAFAAGLLFYSVETASFYVFGKNLTLNQLETRRLDWIDEITPLEETHKEFHKQQYFDALSDMFSSSYAPEVYHVKVLYQDFKNVNNRFQALKNQRENASIRRIDNPPEDCPYAYVYEDRIRGLSGFARYIRSFGISAMAVGPPELVDMMRFTNERILQKNKEVSYESNGNV